LWNVAGGPAAIAVESAAILTSQRRNVFIAALLGTKIEDLASDFFLDG
jgi:hypothetical protein